MNMEGDICCETIFIAVVNECISCIKKISKNGDISRKSRDGWNVFHYIVHYVTPINRVNAIKILLENVNCNTLINSRDVTGWTPLHYASSSLKYDMIRILLENGADQTLVTIKGNIAYNLGKEDSKKIFDDFNFEMGCKEPDL